MQNFVLSIMLILTDRVKLKKSFLAFRQYNYFADDLDLSQLLFSVEKKSELDRLTVQYAALAKVSHFCASDKVYIRLQLDCNLIAIRLQLNCN